MEVEQPNRGVVRDREASDPLEEPPSTRQASRQQEPVQLVQQQHLEPLPPRTEVVSLAELGQKKEKYVRFAEPRDGQHGRLGLGTKGRPIKVTVNASKLTHADWFQLQIQQYDLHFTWVEASAGCPAPLQKGMTDAMLEPLMKLFPNHACCYDGKKNVYAPGILTPDMLTDEARAAHWSVEADESLPGGALWKLLFHGPNKPDSVVTMKAVGEGLNLGRLWGDKGPANLMSMADDAELGAEFRKYMASIDILLQPVRMYKSLKNAYFNENRDANWGYMKQLGRESNQQLWLGYRQTVVDTLDGPMLFIDTAAAAMHAPCDLLSFIATKMKLRHRSEVTKQHVFDARRQLTTMIGGQKPKIVSSHSNREYKLADIDDKPANESTFFDDDAGRERTIADYFTEKGHRLNFPGLPCVCVGKRTDPSKIRIPIELCKLVGGEPMQITPVIQAEMIKETAKEPAERFKEIMKVIADKATGPGVQACAAPAFGVSTGAELVEIQQARVLDSPRLIYKNHRRGGSEEEVRVDQKKGAWNVMQGGQDLGFFDPGAPPRAWVVVNFASRDARNLEPFVQQFMRMASDRGLKLDPRGHGGSGSRPPPILEMDPPRQPKEVGAMLQEQLAKKGIKMDELDLVLAVMPDGIKNFYEALKRWAEATTGVPVQCCKASKIFGTGGQKKALGTDPQYHAGLLLKLNLKLGGGNVKVKNGLGLMQDRPTMVCGVDVHHPPPGSSRPSWAALVASMDQNCSKWHTIVDEQKGRQEQIGVAQGTRQGEDPGFSLLEHMTTCLKEFVSQNGTPPERIIFYRDGVAHNQFEAVMSQEIGAITKALDQQGLTGRCELIFVVAQKKTNARWGARVADGGTVPFGGAGKGGGKGKGGDFGKGKGGGKGGGGGDTLGNVPCGTVVDTTITDRKSFDFYLVSQHGLKGTARPTHFHVLTCPPTLTADEIQQFTFDLCHVYARCTKIASRPAPIYYAHLAAAHAPWYEKEGFKEMTDTWETSSVSSGGSRGSAKSKSNYEPLNAKQAKRLYYC
jgi:eukaryotic translation initiation factor 2C